MDLIGAKIMDEDTQKHNLRREGIIANALGFMNRLNGLFTSAAFYLVFILFKFESGDNPGPEPGNAARFLLTVFPSHFDGDQFCILVLYQLRQDRNCPS